MLKARVPKQREIKLINAEDSHVFDDFKDTYYST